MFRKLRDRRGESISESLVSVLIVALSAAMLATMITAAVNISLHANERTDEIYRELTAAETGTGASPSPGTVTVNDSPVSVTFSALDGEALAAYRRAGGGG